MSGCEKFIFKFNIIFSREHMRINKQVCRKESVKDSENLGRHGRLIDKCM